MVKGEGNFFLTFNINCSELTKAPSGELQIGRFGAVLLRHVPTDRGASQQAPEDREPAATPATAADGCLTELRGPVHELGGYLAALPGTTTHHRLLRHHSAPAQDGRYLAPGAHAVTGQPSQPHAPERGPPRIQPAENPCKHVQWAPLNETVKPPRPEHVLSCLVL